MDILQLELIEGARKARGLTVVIDVLRAFSLECFLYARGAEMIYAVGKEETARALKQTHPEYILIGERGGVKLPGFDYGNSPFQTMDGDFAGKTIIHTTSAGTQGLANVRGADRVLTGSLVNAAAIARYIRREAPKTVSLVAMGLAGQSSGAEDVLCARYIEALLQKEEKPAAIRLFSEGLREEQIALRDTSYASRFFDESLQEVFPQEDFWLCTKPDQFDFVLCARPAGEDVFAVTRLDVGTAEL